MGIVSCGAELRGAGLENEVLMTAFKEYKVQVRNLEREREEKTLNNMAFLLELKMMKQDIERLEVEN